MSLTVVSATIEITKMKSASNEGVCSSLWGAAAAYAR
jgi:hypothetical protein